MNPLTETTAKRINELHEGIMSLLHQGIDKAIQIGQLLTAKKTELKHGEFGAWITENLVFTDRTARNYMKLFENKDKVLQAGTISEAYKMLGEGKTETVSDLWQENIEEDILDIIQEIIEFWKDTSENLPATIKEMKECDLEPFRLNEVRETEFHSYMENEFKDYVNGILNMPKAQNKEEWKAGLRKLGQLDKTLKKLQDAYGKIMIYKSLVEKDMNERTKLCRKRIRELKRSKTEVIHHNITENTEALPGEPASIRSR